MYFILKNKIVKAFLKSNLKNGTYMRRKRKKQQRILKLGT
jgi:hypothetical protein